MPVNIGLTHAEHVEIRAVQNCDVRCVGHMTFLHLFEGVRKQLSLVWRVHQQLIRQAHQGQWHPERQYHRSPEPACH